MGDENATGTPVAHSSHQSRAIRLEAVKTRRIVHQHLLSLAGVRFEDTAGHGTPRNGATDNLLNPLVVRC
jgi:hypothetical protein